MILIKVIGKSICKSVKSANYTIEFTKADMQNSVLLDPIKWLKESGAVTSTAAAQCVVYYSFLWKVDLSYYGLPA